MILEFNKIFYLAEDIEFKIDEDIEFRYRRLFVGNDMFRAF